MMDHTMGTCIDTGRPPFFDLFRRRKHLSLPIAWRMLVFSVSLYLGFAGAGRDV